MLLNVLSMNITLTEKQLINYFVDGQEDACLEVFLSEGPSGLRGYIGVSAHRDDVWRSIYDYFLFEKQFFLTAVTKFQDFLTDVMTVYGPHRVREIFQIQDSKYDELFESAFCYPAVLRKGIFLYVRRNIDRLISDLSIKGAYTVREELHLTGEAYDGIWQEVLDVFLERVGTQKIHERRREHVKEFFRNLRKGLLRSFYAP